MGGNGCHKDATSTVCSKPKGDSDQGVCDLAGNVREWVADGHRDDLSDTPPDGSEYVGTAFRQVNRGDSWDHAGAGRFAARRRNSADRSYYYYNNLGFRLARSL